jgi:N-acetylmuramoyl-L-alanine amidase
LVFGIAVAAPLAAADSITFTGSVSGRTRSVNVDVVSERGVNYLSINQVVSGFGGSTSNQPEFIQVDLAGGQARLTLGQPSVNSSLQDFSLRQPVVGTDGSILMSVTDVKPFLFKAFGLDVEQRVNRVDGESQAANLVGELTEMTRPQPSARPAPVSNPGLPVVIRAAVLDPGHGGQDAGYEVPANATINSSGLKEKDLSLAIAVKVRRLLEDQLGLRVRMTRDTDMSIAERDRVQTANREDGDVLISFHAGASAAATASGYQVYYSPNRSARGGSRGMADTTATGITGQRLAQSIDRALAEKTGAAGRGNREAPLSVFRDLQMPGVLIEVGFLTNTNEALLLADDAYQQKIAEGIAAGIAPFIQAGAGAVAQ